MRDAAEAASLAQQLRDFATYAGRDEVPLYESLGRAAADDESVLAILECAPADQRRPVILFAAVHYLLLRGAEHDLAAHYASVRSFLGHEGPVPELAEAPALFLDFCHRKRGALKDLVATKATQTNEVGRCSALFPGLCEVQRRAGAPLGLVDLGTSAGLNLLVEHYAYDYGDGSPAGNDRSPLVLPCELRAGALPDLGNLSIAWRAGIDQNPLDPGNDEDTTWLLACLWPDQLERFERIRHAFTTARSEPRVEIFEGDIVDDLAKVTSRVPEDLHLCLMHSWVAAYLDPARQRALRDAIVAIGEHRPVSWLFAEWPYEVPELPAPPAPPGARNEGNTALVLVEIDSGFCKETRLADMHPHGRWLEWWGPSALSR